MIYHTVKICLAMQGGDVILYLSPQSIFTMKCLIAVKTVLILRLDKVTGNLLSLSNGENFKLDMLY